MRRSKQLDVLAFIFVYMPVRIYMCLPACECTHAWKSNVDPVYLSSSIALPLAVLLLNVVYCFFYAYADVHALLEVARRGHQIPRDCSYGRSSTFVWWVWQVYFTPYLSPQPHSLYLVWQHLQLNQELSDWASLAFGGPLPLPRDS